MESFECEVLKQDTWSRPTMKDHVSKLEYYFREAEILAAVNRATNHFKICPNRVWSVASSLAGRETILPLLVPSMHVYKPRSQPRNDHSTCTFDFCEYSRRDFTAVQQRHEPLICETLDEKYSCKTEVPRDENPVQRITGGRKLRYFKEHYSSDYIKSPIISARKWGVWENLLKLNYAAATGTSTVWKLDRTGLLERPRPYMALSHVWSDGTGAGVWKEGEVNHCLGSFFEGIARYYECEGLWWDTICIPKEKAARTKAIAKMQENYENARITLVHDCFLREWEWTDPEMACFAIVMSPWFSRGWTALELAKSRRVKVIFKDTKGGFLIKDLDEDILGRVNDTPDRPQLAARVIVSLRNNGTKTVNDLITVLSHRHTSWPRDMAIISGLLVDVDVTDGSQQNIYQRILVKMGQISRGNLFHNSATMSKDSFKWCPTSLFDLTIDPAATDTKRKFNTLQIKSDGSIVGRWCKLDSKKFDRFDFNWSHLHPFMRSKLKVALENEANQSFLVDPEAESFDKALLVKVLDRQIGKEAISYEHVGSLFFNNSQNINNARFDSKEILELTIGAVEKFGTDDIKVGNTGDIDNVKLEEQLRHSCEIGDIEAVRRLLDKGVNANSTNSYNQTALHRAAWMCNANVVDLLLQHESIDATISDDLGQQALHLAAERGHTDIVKQFLLPRIPQSKQSVGTSSFGMSIRYPKFRCNKSQTALHRAAFSGSASVVSLLLRAEGAKLLIDLQDETGRTALYVAAEQGHTSIIIQLLKEGASANIVDWHLHLTPMQRALENGHLESASELAHCTVLSSVNVEFLRSHAAARKGRNHLFEFLLQRKIEGVDLEITEHLNGRSKFSLPSGLGHENIMNLLLGKEVKLDENDISDNRGRTSLSKSVENSNEKTIRLLLSVREVDPALVNVRWDTSLYYMAQGGLKSYKAELFLEENVATSVVDTPRETRTPLSPVVIHGNEQLVDLIFDIGNMEYIPNSSVEQSNRNEEGIGEFGNDKNEGNIKNCYGWKDQCETGHSRATKFQNTLGTSLALASCRGLRSIARVLLNTGKVNVDKPQGKMRMTPLMLAATVGDEEMINILLEHGANVHSRDEENKTALFHAVTAQNIGSVQLLLENSAEIGVYRKKDGMSPLEVAIMSKRTDMLDLLLSHPDSEITVKKADATGRSLLIFAIEIGASNDILQSIIKAPGIDLNSHDNNKVNAMAKMALTGNRDMFYQLRKRGAHATTQIPGDPLFFVHAAEKKVPSDIVEILLKETNSLYLATCLFTLDDNGVSPAHRLWSELEKRKSCRNEEDTRIRREPELGTDLEAENRMRDYVRKLFPKRELADFCPP